MMDRKKRLLSVMAMLTMSALLVSCGEKSTEAVEITEDAVATASEAEASEEVLEKEDADAEQNAEVTDKTEATEESTEAAAEEEIQSKNTMAVKAPGYTGLTNITKENREDGSYFYKDMTEDGITVITNMSYPNSQRDGQDMDAYAENIVCAQVDNDARISGSSEDADLSAKLTYPVFKVEYESGSNEDTKQAVGVVILTDNFTYYFGYECPIDFFEENKDFYEDELKNVELIELTESTASSEEYATAYLNKVNEYDSEGTADGFTLIDVNNDGVPELVAVNSEGPLDDAGNAHLLTYFEGDVAELLSVSEGFDGAHIYISEQNDTVLETGGMSGSEGFAIYAINGNELEKTKDIFALFDVENETYMYLDGNDTIEKQQYIDIFEEAISADNPYFGLDHDKLNETNITIEDGYSNYEVISTQEYLNADQMRKKLEDLGAKVAE